MRTIIAGSRTITDQVALNRLIDRCPWEITQIITGGCYGPDRMGELYARTHGIPCQRYPADWDRFGKAAGPRRNIAMAEDADALIVLWDGISRGSRHMIKTARRYGLSILQEVYQHEP